MIQTRVSLFIVINKLKTKKSRGPEQPLSLQGRCLVFHNGQIPTDLLGAEPGAQIKPVSVPSGDFAGKQGQGTSKQSMESTSVAWQERNGNRRETELKAEFTAMSSCTDLCEQPQHKAPALWF